MRLHEILEIETPKTAITTLSNYAGTMTALNRQLRDLVKEKIRGGEPIKKIKFVVGSKQGTWFAENYLTSKKKRTGGLRSTLQTISTSPDQGAKVTSAAKRLANLRIHGLAKTRERTKETGSSHYRELATNLPTVLHLVGLKDKADQLQKSFQALNDAYAGAKPKQEPKEKKAKPRDELYGQQKSSAEQAVNDIIKNRIPKRLQGQVRNAIAKQSNKLQALGREMERLGIK